MARIRVLDPYTVAQIAAGEVIERPVAVVKELVENALDAGSSRIEVNVVAYPDWRIVVRDDGCGIPAEEVELAFTRHATSKISAPEDLQRISTLGFRGEALPSIAAVAEVEMITRPPEASSGTKIVIRGGETLHLGPCACSPGTRVTVTDLFFNLPARRKHQLEPRKELQGIIDVVGRLALAHPDRAFSLTANGRPLWNTPGKGDLLETIAEVWGAEQARQMVPVTHRTADLGVRGYLSKPGKGRGDRRRQLLIVNGRPIVSERFSQVLEALYEDLSPRDLRPAALLHLRLPPDQIDVNVHPTKATVRFLEEERVWQFLRETVRPALERAVEPALLPRISGTPATSGYPPTVAEAAVVREPGPMEWPRPTLPLLAQERSAVLPEGRLPQLEPIGQLAATYILAQAGGDLYIIDQHAAHERIRYTELVSKGEAAPPSQMLTVPLSLSLGSQDLETFWQHVEVFRRLGYLAEPFGRGAVLIRGVPASLSSQEALEVLQQLLGMIADDRARPESAWLDEGRKMIACRGAIKASQYLDYREMVALLEGLRRVPQPFTCPHGRPAVVRCPQEDLARAFRR